MVCKYCYSENADVFAGVPARNNGVFEYEKYIHRTFYPCIIHPYSRFRVYWEYLMVCHIMARSFIISFLWACVDYASLPYAIVDSWFHLLNLLDLFLSFFTGYVESSTDTVVLDPKKIAVRYLTRTFIFNLMANFPIELVMYFKDKDSALVDTHKCLALVPTYSVCVLSRFVIFIGYMLNLSRVLLWNRLMVGLVIISSALFVNILIAAAFYLCWVRKEHFQDFFMEIIPDEIRFETFINAILLMVLDCLHFDIRFPLENEEIKCFFLSFTLIVTALFSAHFINLVLTYMKHHHSLIEMEDQVLSFIAIRRLNKTLKNRTILYFHILLQNRYSGEYEIVNYIPNTFKGDMFSYLCIPLLKNFPMFEDLPTYVLKRLAEAMDYQLYLPNEVVMSTDETKLRMYFVQRGTVAFYSRNGVELYHFETGSNFNGKNFVLGELDNRHYAISIEVTEIYRLNYEDFVDIMSGTPQLFEKITDKVQATKIDDSYRLE